MKRQVALAVATMMTATLSVGIIASASLRSTPRTTPPITMYYLSLGDSYAQGFQPGYADNSETLDGFPDQLNMKLTADSFGGFKRSAQRARQVSLAAS